MLAVFLTVESYLVLISGNQLQVLRYFSISQEFSACFVLMFLSFWYTFPPTISNRVIFYYRCQYFKFKVDICLGFYEHVRAVRV